MASILERLFPVEQLEALGNKWPENAYKRRKLDNGARQHQTWPMPAPRRQNSGSAIPDPRYHRLSTSSQRSIHPRSTTKSTQIKRSNSESIPRHSPAPSSSSYTSNSTSVQKSCLPSFIEPALMQVYLHNLHPKDRSRYSLPGSPSSETKSEDPRRTMTARHDNEDSISSPESLMTDTSSPQYSGEGCTTPPASAGPFSDLIYSLRLTDHERGFMNDLLNPSPQISETYTSAPGEKRKVPVYEAGVDPANIFDISNDSLPTTFPLSHEVEADFGGYQYAITTNGERENDVRSSGLSPAPEKEQGEDTSPAGIVMPVHSALSVDDFFDLEEAAEDLSPLAI